jgi:Glycosyl transferase family 2
METLHQPCLVEGDKEATPHTQRGFLIGTKATGMSSRPASSSNIREQENALEGQYCPTVSIGVPAYNCEKTLAIAVRSILNQTYGNWELLLMEDGSNDRTLEVAREFSDPRISVFTDHSHKGLVPRLNRAVAMSRGKYFARMDADDVAYPERLERQVEYLERHPGIDLLGCGVLVFKGDGVALGSRHAPQAHEEICRRPAAGFHMGHPTWMGRMEWFRAHSYDAKAVRAEDQVLLLRSYSTSRFACLSEVLCGYREERLDLGKILRGRCSFTIAAFREFFERREYSTALGGALEQCAKAIVDILAISTGLGYMVLRHRARPVATETVARWSGVWTQVQGHTEPTFSSADFQWTAQQE